MTSALGFKARVDPLHVSLLVRFACAVTPADFNGSCVHIYSFCHERKRKNNAGVLGNKLLDY